MFSIKSDVFTQFLLGFEILHLSYVKPDSENEIANFNGDPLFYCESVECKNYYSDDVISTLSK